MGELKECLIRNISVSHPYENVIYYIINIVLVWSLRNVDYETISISLKIQTFFVSLHNHKKKIIVEFER